MAQNHLEQVLQTAGLTPEQVKALAELPQDAKEFKADEHVTPLNTAAENRLRNDPKFYENIDRKMLPAELIKTLEAEQYGRAASIVRSNMLKATGLTEQDFKELGDDGKKIEVFTPAFAKRLAEGKITDKELQTKLMEANNKLAELEADLPKQKETMQAEFDRKLSEEKTGFIVLAALAQVPGLKVPPGYIADKVTAKLRDQYDLVVNGAEAEVRQKGKPEMKVLIDNGTKALTLAGAITQILTTDNLIEKAETKDPKKGTTQVTVEPEKGKFKVSGHIAGKIDKRLQQEGATQ